MATDIRAILREVLDRTDEEDRGTALEARLVALEQRQEAGGTITTAQILAALEQATDEELEALHGSYVDKLAREVEERRENQETDEQRQAREAAEAATAAEAERLRLEQEGGGGTAEVRPGRKQGQAYNWETDDDGNVVPLEVARIWSEPDEADEVSLPAAVVEEVPA